MLIRVRADRPCLMWFGSGWRKTAFGATVFALLLLGAACLATVGQQSSPSRKLILEVVNRHFTVGQHIPSVYLRVYSDGTSECHTEKFWDEADIVKHKTLGPEELQALQAVLDNPELFHANEKYGLMALVIDSWMEWDIRVPHGWRSVKIKVLNFSPASARQKNQPYPPAVLRLGCSIWKLRNEVYGDAQYGGEPFYYADDCKEALRTE
jgi:hypothetical protein